MIGCRRHVQLGDSKYPCNQEHTNDAIWHVHASQNITITWSESFQFDGVEPMQDKPRVSKQNAELLIDLLGERDPHMLRKLRQTAMEYDLIALPDRSLENP